jgi:hypothetical protein
MTKTFKYRVCQAQLARVTFVNGRWQGLQIPAESNPAELYNSCPMVWEYLESAGRDGWELVAATSQLDGLSQSQSAASLLFLKKEVSPEEDGPQS